MPKGQMSEADRQRLSDHFFAVVAKACVRNNCWPGEVLNRLRKSRKVPGISAARAEIVKEMRQTAYTYYRQGQCLLLLFATDTKIRAMPQNAIPISFPLLARMIGCDHSALVLAQGKVKRTQENDHA